IEGKLDITKISYGVLPLLTEEYALLNSGGALGKGVGPLLIANKPAPHIDVQASMVAIPGRNTTAHLLFSLAYPEAKNKVFLRYYEIEDFVLADKGLGVIIHENRFTYMLKGLKKIADLGDFWEKETGNPIPLGGIVIKRTIEPIIQQNVDLLIKKSIEFAYSNYPALNDFIRMHSQEMSEKVMRQHIDLYVNDYSLDLGPAGKKAVNKLLEVYSHANNLARKPVSVFRDEL
ncbi:MAG: 1,4-dihydroxy-6-naphthoate synthase, partial [Ferruginibacter sp.]